MNLLDAHVRVRNDCSHNRKCKFLLICCLSNPAAAQAKAQSHFSDLPPTFGTALQGIVDGTKWDTPPRARYVVGSLR